MKFDWNALLLYLPKLLQAILSLFEGENDAQVVVAAKKAAETGDASDFNRRTNDRLRGNPK